MSNAVAFYGIFMLFIIALIPVGITLAITLPLLVNARRKALRLEQELMQLRYGGYPPAYGTPAPPPGYAPGPAPTPTPSAAAEATTAPTEDPNP